MNIYELRTSRYGNLEWKAYYLEKEELKTGLIESITNNELYSTNIPIKMLYVNIYDDSSKMEEIPFSNDMVRWLDDITYRAFTPKGQGYMIVSKKLKSILREFTLPPHSYYTIELIDEINNISNKEYELLHIYGPKWYEHLIIEECVFEYRDEFTDEIIRTQKGGFRSYKDMLEESKKASEKEDCWYYLVEGVFNVNYDLMWGIGNMLRINEKLKEAIENGNLKGVECFSLKKNKMKYISYNEYLDRDNI
ncbi:hypothetical protein [Tenacibaculum ascidiaceicola]|uniref:hypothetical protein n=1 Tax=Tenacibaculum ascidiaceicola TaxID=1699411 RepID=UPI003CE4B74C